MKKTVGIFVLTFFLAANASKCPESRKPHVTSCTIFYDCVNLPEGGYVWVPSKCAEGLVFQPYLRLCVLPGDSWSCKDSSIENSTHHNFGKPQIVDATKTSYLEIFPNTVHSSSRFDELMNIGNLIPIKPYPLIQVGDVSSGKKHEKNGLQNEEIQISHGETEAPDMKEVISRIFFFFNFEPSLKQQTFVSSPGVDLFSRESLAQLVENYIINHKSGNKKSKRKSETKKMTEIPIDKVEMSSETPSSIEKLEENPDLIIDGANHVVSIIRHLDRKEYITVGQYRSLANNKKIQVLDVIPCMTGIRLPNMTDCIRYYTCDPNTANVHEFRCPARTAFNDHTNYCDPQKYKSCMKIRNIESTDVPIASNSEEATVPEEKGDEAEDQKQANPCETTGKFGDPTSKNFYYLCYSSSKSGMIESIRMPCPNDLIFCQERKVCTAKRLCTDAN